MRGVVVFCALTGFAMGCGGDSASAHPPVAITPAPKVFGSLTILLKPSTIAEVNNAVQSALVEAGYNVVADARALHNAVADLTATATEIPSIFQVRVNGITKKNFRINVTLVLRNGSRVIDQFSTEFEAEGGQVESARLNAIVRAMNRSKRVKGFAVEQASVVAQREAAAKAEADDEAAKKAAEDIARAEDDANFNRILSDCREPKNATSCDELKALYLRSEPQRGPGRAQRTGKDMQRDAERHLEAGEVLEASKSAIRDFADDETWAQANHGRCALGDDCMAVHRYLSQFPSGKHAEAARKAVSDGARVRAERDEREQRQAEAEERAQTARARQASCKSRCASETCIAYTAVDKKAACVAQCVEACK